MEIEPMSDEKVERWVTGRLASLEADAAWQPDQTAAWMRFRRRRRARAAGRNSLFLVAAAALSLFVLGDFAPRACANPRGCEDPAAASGVPLKALAPAQFKLAGNPHAPVTLEVYSDYQCPDCMRFFLQIFPQLDAQYIQTGKIKFLHRDFPLPQHQYAKLAARYANASGQIGKYSVAVNAIFRARNDWAADGNLAAALAPVLSAEEMKAVLRAVDSDARLDDTVAEDMAMAAKDRIMHTPTLVIVTKTGRQALAYDVPFETLKTYLDAVLAK
jgi:protein-disulfide isomerase